MAEKEKKEGKEKGGRDQPPSGDRDEGKKVPAKGPTEMPSKLFEIEISNPFFTGPQSVTLYDPTVQQKALGKPGQKESKGSL
jgi:hypothetical protein